MYLLRFILILSPLLLTNQSTSGDLRVEVKHKVTDCKRRTQKGDRITWTYTGTLVSGKGFDEGTFTATLGAGDVIEGMDRAMRKMCVGEKRKAIIPPHLGYGEKGTNKQTNILSFVSGWRRVTVMPDV